MANLWRKVVDALMSPTPTDPNRYPKAVPPCEHVWGRWSGGGYTQWRDCTLCGWTQRTDVERV